MSFSSSCRRTGASAGALLFVAVACGAPPAEATGSGPPPPHFDAVVWTALDCPPGGDPAEDANPGWVDLVGNASYPAAATAADATYLYLRLRLASDPRHGMCGLRQDAWGTFAVGPAADPLAPPAIRLRLNGKDDRLEIWKNGIRVYDRWAWQGGPGAHVRVRTDGAPQGMRDLLEMAFPITALVQAGLIASAAELPGVLLDPYTGTTLNDAIKDRIDACRFMPSTTLALTGTVTPAAVPVHETTAVEYRAVVTNGGAFAARGLVLVLDDLPAFAGPMTPTLVPSDPAVVPTIIGTAPLRVTVPLLPPGTSLTVLLAGPATPSCADGSTVAEVRADALNAAEQSQTMTLAVTRAALDDCDGRDGDCDGSVDEDGAALCDDDDPCTGEETCADGACVPGEPPACADATACTLDACAAGAGCTHTPIAGCVVCATAETCGDADACTADACVDGACVHTPLVGCDHCESAAACADGDACTTDACVELACVHAPVAGCEACETAAGCDDADACTTDACVERACVHGPLAGCIPCQNAAECADDDACTTEACEQNACVVTPLAGCEPCTTAADCRDGAACTADACIEGACTHEAIAGCVPCETAAACADGDACTDDACVNGACVSTPIAACVPCTTSAECVDGQTCTMDACIGGVCQHGAIEGCVPCETEAACGDDDACTADTCESGMCVHRTIAECGTCTPTAELCGNGTDDDCDGLTDCGDDDCTAATECVRDAEICYDCVDNDGDGLIDAADPECCGTMEGLVVRRMVVAPHALRPERRLRLRTRDVNFDLSRLDPMRQDVAVQIFDRDGQAFCACIAPQYWRKRRYGYSFVDRAHAFAAGLDRGRMRVRGSNGMVRLMTRGDGMRIRGITGGQAHVYVRAGDQCFEAVRDVKARPYMRYVVR